MAITRLGGANAISGTIPQGNIANASLGAVTALPTGLGGKVLQVKQTVKTDTFSRSANSFADITGMSVSITPASSSNKVYVICDLRLGCSATSGAGMIKLLRDSTNIYVGTDTGSNRIACAWGTNDFSAIDTNHPAVICCLDSPATTSSTTYKLQMSNQRPGSQETIYLNRDSGYSDDQQLPALCSSITVMEISA